MLAKTLVPEVDLDIRSAVSECGTRELYSACTEEPWTGEYAYIGVLKVPHPRLMSVSAENALMAWIDTWKKLHGLDGAFSG